MSFIKVNDNMTVVGPLDTVTMEQQADGWFEYTGEIYMFSIWDDKLKIVVPNPELMRQAKKDIGVAYINNNQTYLIPLSKDTQDTVTSLMVALSANAFTFTNIKLENGVIMPMTAEDLPAFAVWFAGERNKLFL